MKQKKEPLYFSVDEACELNLSPRIAQLCGLMSPLLREDYNLASPEIKRLLNPLAHLIFRLDDIFKNMPDVDGQDPSSKLESVDFQIKFIEEIIVLSHDTIRTFHTIKETIKPFEDKSFRTESFFAFGLALMRLFLPLLEKVALKNPLSATH